MAKLRALSKQDIEKRGNDERILRRTMSGNQMLTTGEVVEGRGKVKLLNVEFDLTEQSIPHIAEQLKAVIRDNPTIRPGMVMFLTEKGWINLTQIHKDNEYSGQKRRIAGSDGRKDQERQERGLIDIIKKLTLDGPFRLPGINQEIAGVEKVGGINSLGKEPYTDIRLIAKNGEEINISCKEDKPPSLGGGGLAGLKLVSPELTVAFFKKLEDVMKKSGLKNGEVYHYSQVKDFFGHIKNRSYLNDIFVGDKRLGGPIHYMYVGKMDVVWDGNNFNGRFIPVQDYIKKYDFYIRLRKRDVQAYGGFIKIEFNKKSKEGFPLVFVDPRQGKVMSRIVIENRTYEGVVFDV